MQLSRPALRHRLADARGVAAVEFALIVPILILLYFGVVELTQGIMTQQRTTHTASTVGDLVAQSSSVTSAEVTDIFDVGASVMYPYPTTTLGLRVSSLVADSKGNVTVAWSQASGTLSKLAAGTVVTGLPNNVINANESVILAESQDTYTSPFNYILPKPITFSEKSYLRPRLSTSVTCADC